MINRFSSRRQSLETSFIKDRLENAVSYIDWESYATVLDEEDKKKVLAEGW